MSKIFSTSSWPTVNDEPGVAWSMPAGSKSTCSNAQRIGQSTFQTSLPSFWVARLVTPTNPHDWQVYDRSVVSSSYAVMWVVSRPHSRQYGLNGNRSSPAPAAVSTSSSSATESASSSASCSDSGARCFVRYFASTASMSSRWRTACSTCSR